MDLQELNKEYAKMQKKYGALELDAICNGGCSNNPNICFVFMNPTGKNIASIKTWKGLKAPWLGTKTVWSLFYDLNLITDKTYTKIRSIKGSEWSEKFCDEVYQDVTKHKVWITNLGKCTQVDARVLPDNVFLKYRDLLIKEIELINPKVIILFGNQVSGIVLNKKISVSKCRKEKFEMEISSKKYTFYSVFYPVGNGRFNIDKTIEDLNYILETELKEKVR